MSDSVDLSNGRCNRFVYACCAEVMRSKRTNKKVVVLGKIPGVRMWDLYFDCVSRSSDSAPNGTGNPQGPIGAAREGRASCTVQELQLPAM